MALDRSPKLCNVISNAKHIKTIILTKIHMKPPVLKDFPSFGLAQHGLDIIKTNILTKFQLAQSKNAASGVLTLFSFNLA